MKLHHSHKIILALILLVFTGGFRMAEEKETEKKIINDMLASIKKLQTLKYTLTVSERVKDKMITNQTFVKQQINPQKVYLKLLREGQEILWIKDNGDDALVNPNAFPYFNLNLNINGSIMRDGQHHSIATTGFEYIYELVNFGLKRTDVNFFDYISYKGISKWNNRDCYNLSLDFPLFAYESYTVKANETLLTIAAKLHVNEYMILQKNSSLDSDYKEVIDVGTKILVPNLYAKKISLCVDKETSLPVNQKIYDEISLFESYEFYNVVVNPPFAPNEFSRDFREYGF